MYHASQKNIAFLDGKLKKNFSTKEFSTVMRNKNWLTKVS